jgi:nucleotide-binding universal stress UspA family protein
VKPVTLGILVLATDGSADAVLARRAVADLARATDATVHLVSAWTVPAAIYSYPTQVVPDDLTSQYEGQATAILEQEHQALEEDGVRLVTDHVVFGRAPDAILDVAGSVGADLVIVGNRGHGALTRLALGSVSEAVVRQATLPVLVVRGGEQSWPPENVVAGHDGSDEAIAALRLAALVAGRVNSPLSVLEVMPSVDGVGDADLSVGDILEGRRGQLEGEVRDLIGSPSGDLDVRVEMGDPAAMLLEVARPSTMIAVGRRGIGRVREMFLGSVSTKVLHGAHGAVLLVPHP